MNDVLGIVRRLEGVGGELTLDGERIRYRIPVGDSEALSLLTELRGRRSDVAELLRARAAQPAMPAGVRLIRYQPKQPPVMVESYAVVTDVQKFIEAELQELGARLHAPVQIRGGFGIFTILDWLAQCGVDLEIVRPHRSHEA